MNTPLKFDHDPRKLDQEPLKFDLEKRPKTREKRPRKQPVFRFNRSDYRAHYEDLVVHGLSSIVRHRGLIVSFVGLALALACIIIPLMPRKYSAEALIYPNLLSREQEKVVALASVDAAAIVNGESRLLRSDAILRAAAKRLGNDPNATTSRSWVTRSFDWFRAALLPETRNHSPFDRKVAILRNKVVVMNDTRSYLISISFTAPAADEAAQVVNAIAIEYIREKDLQRRRNAAAAAEGELWRQLAVYGDKHPKTLQAVEGLDAARASLKAAMSRQDDGQDEVMSDGSVKLAVPNRTPTSPKGIVILGLSVLAALLAGIGVAIWRDRRNEQRKHTIAHQPNSE